MSMCVRATRARRLVPEYRLVCKIGRLLASPILFGHHSRESADFEGHEACLARITQCSSLRAEEVKSSV